MVIDLIVDAIRALPSSSSEQGAAGAAHVFLPPPVVGRSATELRAHVDGVDPSTGEPVMRRVIDGLTKPTAGPVSYEGQLIRIVWEIVVGNESSSSGNKVAEYAPFTVVAG